MGHGVAEVECVGETGSTLGDKCRLTYGFDLANSTRRVSRPAHIPVYPSLTLFPHLTLSEWHLIEAVKFTMRVLLGLNQPSPAYTVPGIFTAQVDLPNTFKHITMLNMNPMSLIHLHRHRPLRAWYL